MKYKPSETTVTEEMSDEPSHEKHLEQRHLCTRCSLGNSYHYQKYLIKYSLVK
ncbi:hypothetical protein ACVNP1_03400 [Staphylococcus aureus]